MPPFLTKMMKNTHILQQQLKDARSRKVIFLSHCLLNENVRYLGGACQSACVKEIVEWCQDNDLGIVQMPCPEQKAWGGVNKRWLLMGYGAKGTLLYHMRHMLLPLFLQYTRLIYGWLSKTVADQINDYLDSGYSVAGVMGIDGSPSCGVNTTLAFEKSFDLVAGMDVETITIEQMNAIIRQCATEGSGLFTLAVKNELTKRHIDLPYGTHDLLAEIDGRIPAVNTLFR